MAVLPTACIRAVRALAARFPPRLLLRGGTIRSGTVRVGARPLRLVGLARGALLVACLSVALGGLAACGGDRSGDQAGAEARDRALILGYASELQTLNPVVSTDQMANEIMWYLLYTPLVVYDSAYRVRPWLAESWELDEAGVTFRLREDVRWHDGEPVTAEDVKFTFDLAKEPATASPLAAAYLGEVASAEVLGPHRIRFEFAAPHAQPLEGFFWPPVPRHRLEGVSGPDVARHPFNREPVGSGPYRFREWRVSQGVTLEAAESFPEALGGPAAIGRVVYRIVPERTTLLQEFLRGQVHVHGPASPAEADRIREASGVELLSFPWRLFTYIGWNGRRPPFDEPEVRRALALAIDREALLEAVLRGQGTIASSVIPPWHPLSPDLAPLPHAPDSARAILARHGWRDNDGDGVLDREGRPFRFVLLASQRSPVYADLVEVLQAQLARVGVAAEPRLLEWQTVLSLHRQRDFDAVLTNWVLDGFRVDPRPLFHGDQADVEGSANRGSYRNPEADRLMDRGVRTTDEEEARDIWARLARILQRDQPVTLLFWNDELAGVSETLDGVRMDARGELVTVPRWRWRGEARSDGAGARSEESAGAPSDGAGAGAREAGGG